MGREIGRIVHETMDLERSGRRAEIERRVLAWLGAGMVTGTAGCLGYRAWGRDARIRQDAPFPEHLGSRPRFREDMLSRE